MRKAKGIIKGFGIHLAIVGLLLCGPGAVAGLAQSAGQKTYKTPQAAVDALFSAAKHGDRKDFVEILGPDAIDLIAAGDKHSNARVRHFWVSKYDLMHRLVAAGDRTEMLYVGAENWPMPIPIREGKAGWYFDTHAAKQEILARRIGVNELDAINVCRAIVAAQHEYHDQLHDGDKVPQYARYFASRGDKHNGLYWKAGPNQPQSPLGPRLAMAAYHPGAPPVAGAALKPYHGYFYKILTAQGKNAHGGAMDYLVDGKLTKGFAVLAYPAKYRITGVVTFIVNQDGIVYQKDLGPDTEKAAPAISEYDPDSSWVRAN